MRLSSIGNFVFRAIFIDSNVTSLCFQITDFNVTDEFSLVINPHFRFSISASLHSKREKFTLCSYVVSLFPSDGSVST